MDKTSDSQSIELAIQLLGDDDIDPQDIDNMTRLLRSELEECSGAREVKLAPGDGESREGAKTGAEVFALGAILAAVLPKAVPAIIDYLKEWTLRPGNRPLKIKLQKGERSVEVEFDPRTVSEAQVSTLVAELQTLVDQKPE